MQSLTVIHLSDLHLRKKTEFDTNSILGTLVTHIKRTISDQNLDSPFVAIGGDLTFSGKQAEFDLVREFLGIIEDKIKPVGVIFSPGNHDMNWKEHLETSRNSELMEDLINHPGHRTLERIEKSFSKKLDLIQLKAGMSNYYNYFLKQVGQKYDDNYLYSLLSMQVEKFKINFVSLNSAYLFSDRYPRFGYIGKTQIEKAYAEAQEKLPDDYQLFNIALFHHNFEAIAPASLEETEDLVKSRFNVILSGHVHNLRVYMDLTANLVGENRRRPIISCTRCVFDEKGDPSITPGYSIIRIDFDADTVSSTGIYESKYNRISGKWIQDPELDYPIIVPDFSKEAPKPKLLHSDREMYLAGIKIANCHARKNLIVYQKTPSLLLGAKPYDQPDKSKKFDYERDFMVCLESKIKSCVESKNTSILYLFSESEAKDVLERFPQIRKDADDNIDILKKKEEDSGHQFRFEPASFRVSGPLMMGDSGYMLWVGSRNIGKSTEIMVLTSDHSAETDEMIRDLGGKLAIKQTTAEQLKSLLGLRK